MLLICSVGPRGLCGDPRIFGDLTKVPQVFRNPGGSRALPMTGSDEFRVTPDPNNQPELLPFLTVVCAKPLMILVPADFLHIG